MHARIPETPSPGGECHCRERRGGQQRLSRSTTERHHSRRRDMEARCYCMDDLLMEHLVEHGLEGMLAVFTAAYNMGMKVDRECFIPPGNAPRREFLGTIVVVSCVPRFSGAVGPESLVARIDPYAWWNAIRGSVNSCLEIHSPGYTPAAVDDARPKNRPRRPVQHVGIRYETITTIHAHVHASGI